MNIVIDLEKLSKILEETNRNPFYWNNIITECEVKPKQQDASEIFTEVIEFAIQTDSSKEFLQCWLEGDFESIKNEWPEFKGYLGEEK